MSSNKLKDFPILGMSDWEPVAETVNEAEPESNRTTYIYVYRNPVVTRQCVENQENREINST